MTKETSTQQNRDLLFAEGFRKTGPRNIILGVLEFATKPLSVDAIHIEVNKKASCDQATVYRNLKSMVQKDIVLEKYFCHGHAHYELASDPHSHIVCRHCEHIEELPDFGGEEMAKKLFKKAKKFKEMSGFSFEIYGICNNCKRK
jgi:Fe2+ or Zn2+ uptake regulation protein